MLNMRETIPEVFRAMEKQVYKDICKYDGCFPKIEYAENLKDEVLENALNGYAKGCKKEDVIAICAAEQNGKKGILFSTEGMYNSWTIEEGHAPFTPVLYHKIEHTKAEGSSRLTINDYYVKTYSMYCRHTQFCSYVLGWTAKKIFYSRVYFPEEKYCVGDLTRGLAEAGPKLILHVNESEPADNEPEKVETSILLLNLKTRDLKVETYKGLQKNSCKVRYKIHTGEYIGAGLVIDYNAKKILNFSHRPVIYEELKAVPVGTIVQLYEAFDHIYYGFCEKTSVVEIAQFTSEKSPAPDWILSLDGNICQKMVPDQKFYQISTAEGVLKISDLEKHPVDDQILDSQQIQCGEPVTVWREMLSNGQKQAIVPEEIFAETEIEFESENKKGGE